MVFCVSVSMTLIYQSCWQLSQWMTASALPTTHQQQRGWLQNYKDRVTEKKNGKNQRDMQHSGVFQGISTSPYRTFTRKHSVTDTDFLHKNCICKQGGFDGFKQPVWISKGEISPQSHCQQASGGDKTLNFLIISKTNSER